MKMMMVNPSKEAIDDFLCKPVGRYNRTVAVIADDVKLSEEVKKYAKEKDVKFVRLSELARKK